MIDFGLIILILIAIPLVYGWTVLWCRLTGWNKRINRSKLQEEVYEETDLRERPSVSGWREVTPPIGILFIVASLLMLSATFNLGSTLLLILSPCSYLTGIILIGIRHPTAAVLLFVVGIIMAGIIFYFALGVYLVSQYIVDGP